jgi:valyl-tRNA synthetase
MIADADAAAEMDWVVRLISDVRAVRAEMNVPPGAKLPLLHRGASPATMKRMETHRDLIQTLARISELAATDALAKGAVQMVLDEATFILPLQGVIDISAEKARLEREIKKLDQEIARFDAKLANAGFVAKAPPEVVETERERRDETAATRSKLSDAKARLQAAM